MAFCCGSMVFFKMVFLVFLVALRWSRSFFGKGCGGKRRIDHNSISQETKRTSTTTRLTERDVLFSSLQKHS